MQATFQLSFYANVTIMLQRWWNTLKRGKLNWSKFAMFSIANLDAKFIERFWARAEVGNPYDCWHWKGGKWDSGYGRFYLKGKRVAAHRVSYWIKYGHFDESLDVLHSCDNPICVNPSHLWLGTHQDNMQDRSRKGRGNHPKGEKAGPAKLTDEIVLEMRRLYSEGKSTTQLSALFKVPENTIKHVVYGQTWKHLPFSRRPTIQEQTINAITQIKLCGQTAEELLPLTRYKNVQRLHGFLLKLEKQGLIYHIADTKGRGNTYRWYSKINFNSKVTFSKG